jgi:hypothetical protein
MTICLSNIFYITLIDFIFKKENKMNFIISLMGLACLTIIICAFATAPAFFAEFAPTPVVIVLSIGLYLPVIAIAVNFAIKQMIKNQKENETK